MDLVAEKLRHQGMVQIDVKDDLPVYAYNGRALVDGVGLWPLAEHDGMYAVMFQGRVVGWMVPPVETTGAGDDSGTAADEDAATITDPQKMGHILHQRGLTQIDTKDNLPVYAYNGRALVDGLGLWPLEEHDGMYALMYHGHVVGWMVPPVETTGATGDDSGTAADEDAATITDPQKMGHILHRHGLTQIDTKDNLPVFANNPKAMTDGLGLWPLPDHDGMYAVMYQGHVVGWMVPLPDASEPAADHAGDTGTDTHGGKGSEGGKDAQDTKGHSGRDHVVARLTTPGPRPATPGPAPVRPADRTRRRSALSGAHRCRRPDRHRRRGPPPRSRRCRRHRLRHPPPGRQPDERQLTTRQLSAGPRHPGNGVAEAPRSRPPPTRPEPRTAPAPGLPGPPAPHPGPHRAPPSSPPYLTPGRAEHRPLPRLRPGPHHRGRAARGRRTRPGRAAARRGAARSGAAGC